MASAWPPAVFHFVIQFDGDGPAYFREVSGLDGDPKPMEYRRDGRDKHAPIRVPTGARVRSITLHRGLLDSSSNLLKWCRKAGTATVDRRTVTIQLLNDSDAVTTSWTLENAWPVRFTGVVGHSERDVAVEAIELTFDSMTQR